MSVTSVASFAGTPFFAGKSAPAPKQGLIVEDEGIQLANLREGLTSAGLVVQGARNEVDAKAIIDTDGPILNFVVSDLNLGKTGGNGLDVLRYAKTNAPQASLFALTASNDRGTLAELDRIGVVQHFLKPIQDTDNLGATIKRHLDVTA